MTCLLAHSVFALVLLALHKVVKNEPLIFWLKTSLNIFIALVLLLHAPVLCLQLYSQCKKMRTDHAKVEQEEDEIADEATTEVSIDLGASGEAVREKKRCICCKNFKALWKFEPQSQEYVFK